MDKTEKTFIYFLLYMMIFISTANFTLQLKLANMEYNGLKIVTIVMGILTFLQGIMWFLLILINWRKK